MSRSTPHWLKTARGYELEGNALARRGKRWRIITEAGEEHDLGTRASFDHAEAILRRVARQ